MGEMTAAMADTSDDRERRAVAVSILAEARRRGNAALQAAFEAAPLDARELVTSQAFLTDGLVQTTFAVALNFLHPAAVPTDSERIALLAVGGYGRAEMAPHSDIDLLFLTPWKTTPWAESVVESMLYMLWDLKLKVGHATRTVKDCIRLGREDITIRTALLEHRYIAGDAALAGELKDKLWSDLFRGTEAEFIEAKLHERAERHKRQGGQRYVLEPNVKEAKGGLRDLQTLYWIAKYIHHVEKAEELVGLGVFRREEYENFRAAETFLWAARCHLHYITGRAMDQLTFDMQVEVAARMGYQDGGGRRGVERFMQDYFRHATTVGELTRIFLTALEAQHVKKEPVLIGLLRRRKKLHDGMAVVQNRLTVANPKAFLADKLNILRIFEEGLRSGTRFHPDAMRLLAANLALIDDELRNSPEA
ncbi:MAG: [protein-PII] uridylyltransferase, partial [Paracoccaceae bacterium]|nr:[protein-PII] uridylyltransferase [Paracoccaceae bacterium]